MKPNIKSIISVSLAAAVASSAQAEILSAEAALQRALKPTGAKEGTRFAKKAAMGIETPHLAFTLTDDADTPAAYVFTPVGSAEGFCVVSASDLTYEAILGYSDNGAFDPQNIPYNMRQWLDGYAAQIAAAEKSGYSRGAYARPRAAMEKQPIQPLVTTYWNQSAPYNDLCPMLNGRRSVTGCMATAEAQVLNYHKFPRKATGTVSYKWTSGGGNLECQFDTIPLQWDQMANIYNDQTTPEQNKAVANLMLACGYASKMNYSPSQSGATSVDAAQGAFNYLGCSQVGIVLGDWLSFEDLNNYVYDYLVKNGPLLYCGQSSGGGHAFVCDGYNGDGYFHFNWGWGGMSDGYFVLNALNPGSQGIGGTSSGYNTSQQLLPGLYEPKPAEEWTPVMAADAGMVISSDYNTVLGDTIIVGTTEETGGFWNFNMDAVTVTYGLKFVKNATGVATYQECYGIVDRELGSMRGWREYPMVVPEGLGEGTYSVYAACRVNGKEWQDFLVEQSVQTFTLATVKGDSILFEKPRPADVEVSKIEFGTPLYAGGGFTLTASIEGTGDRNFYSKIAPVLGEYYGDDFVSDFQGADIVVSAKAGEESTFTYTGNFTNQRLKGKYTLVFVVSETGKIISEPIEVTINPYPGKATPSASHAEIADANSVDPNNVRVKATVTSETGYFSEHLYLAVGTETDGAFSLINRMESPIYYILPNASAEVTFGGALSATEGEIYVAYLQYYDAKTRKYIDISGPMSFVIKSAGIGAVGSDDIDTRGDYINLKGINMGSDRDLLPAGTYIVGGKKVIVK